MKDLGFIPNFHDRLRKTISAEAEMDRLCDGPNNGCEKLDIDAEEQRLLLAYEEEQRLECQAEVEAAARETHAELVAEDIALETAENMGIAEAEQRERVYQRRISLWAQIQAETIDDMQERGL